MLFFVALGNIAAGLFWHTLPMVFAAALCTLAGMLLANSRGGLGEACGYWLLVNAAILWVIALMSGRGVVRDDLR
jgi:hypothetical protein